MGTPETLDCLPPGGWYIGFDPATKTLAYSLSWIDLSRVCELKSRHSILSEALKRMQGDPPAAFVAACRKLSDDTRSCIKIVACDCADLAPGVPDKDIPTLDRIRLLVKYLTDIVQPQVALWCPSSTKPVVVIEHQMGANCKSRTIVDAIIAYYAILDYGIIEVGPSVKNSAISPHLCDYAAYSSKYKTLYTANKEHSKDCFRWVVKNFTCTLFDDRNSSIGHIADSFLQVLGVIKQNPSLVIKQTPVRRSNQVIQ